MQPDNELLRQYATARSEEAFAELVKRHVNLVYSAALRQAGGDAHLARDVAQNVFTDLARKASSLLHRQTLSGWLYTSAYFAANKMVRAENRRREREIQFMREPGPDNTPETDWDKLRPLLDSAMHDLRESDREAVLLRYFENRPYAEVGAKLGLNENAARLRVERAVEKLRAGLAKRAITTTAGLASVISANAIQVAPPALAATLTKTSIATAAASAGFWSFMTPAKIQLGFSALIAAGALTAVLLQSRAQQSLTAQNQSLAEQLSRLKTENATLSNQLLAVSNSQSSLSEQQAELLRLRAEVTRLRLATNRPTASPIYATNPVAEKRETEKVEIVIKTRFVLVPAAKMPEIKSGWSSVGDGASVLSEEQFDRIRKKMEDRSIDLINEGEVTTLNGRQANFQVIEAASDSATNLSSGLTVDLVPYFSTNSSIFTLDVLASLSSRPDGPSRPAQLLQTSNQFQLYSGQTAALERDTPADFGWTLPNFPNEPLKLLIFVTPTAVDAAGNRLKITQHASTTEATQDK